MSEDLPGMLAVAKGVAEQRWPHTMDAKVWADEFMKMNPPITHGLMLGWFANAIMAGYDTAQQRAAPSEKQTHVHRCMSCGESWFCPHPPADCKAGESVFPTLQLRGPNGVAQFDHICQRKK